MDVRILDIRLTPAGRRALLRLQATLRLGRPGDVLRLVAARGVRPSPERLGARREPLGERMRATVEARMAEDIRTLAGYGGTSVERYVDALLREAETRVERDGSWIEKASTPNTTTTASTATRSTTRTTLSRSRSAGRDLSPA